MTHDDLPPLPPLRLGLYRHYKGGEYEVVAAARHSESLDPMVVYKPLYEDRGWWVRPLRMFLEDVEIDGRRQPRFAYLGRASTEGHRHRAAPRRCAAHRSDQRCAGRELPRLPGHRGA